MEACEVVRPLFNKAKVPAKPKKPWNPDYGPVKALKILVYARLKGLHNGPLIVEHLKKHSWATKTLGLEAVPNRTTVGRWWRRYLNFLEETFLKIVDLFQLTVQTKIAVVASTLLVDFYYMKAAWGSYK